jgi:hypothetical protein
MNVIVAAPLSIGLTTLVDRAVAALSNARTSAEVLEARDLASFAYDAAKRAGRLARAKQAHDELISAAYRTQADALEIEAQAKRRLADEYDAAQDRGEVARIGDNLPSVPEQNSKPTAADIGLTRKDIHEARIIRDAEQSDPGIIRRTLNEVIERGEEPTKATLRRAVLETARPNSQPKQSRRDIIRERVRESLLSLSGLPPAAEVAGYFRDTDASILISERVDTAAAWLSAFAEAWRNGEC